MKKPDSPTDDDSEAADLARRLTRYRTRVEAEGRKRSLQVIDRAINDVESRRSADKR